LDLVLLVEGKPVIARLYLRNGDRPYGAAMQDWTAKLFKWFDRDGDGFLSNAEAARLMPAAYIASLSQDRIRGDAPQSVPFATLDRNKDGKVSLEEFRAYLRRSFPELALQSINERAVKAKRLNDVLWRRLDTNKDGKLSAEEVARLPELLRKYDEDEDEQLSEAELLQEGTPLYYQPRRMTPATPGTGFFLSLGDVGTQRAAATLLRAYDKNGDGKLTAAEVGLDKDEFARLDFNHDGKLDVRELEMFCLRKPDIVFRGRVGSMGGVPGLIESVGLGARRMEVLSPPGVGLAKGVKRVSADALRLPIGNTMIDLTVQAGNSVSRFRGAPNFFLRQFDTLMTDKSKRGLTRAQAKDNVYISALFTAADRNADGTLERGELSAFLNLVVEAASAKVALEVDDGGQSLFQVIDADGNGFLSPREMRSAWSRIKPLCKDGKLLAREDLPRRVNVRMIEGDANARVAFAMPTGAPPPSRGIFSTGAPAWFIKMDKNGDGDISRAEWLGSEEDFKRFDLDGDGLISVAEAKKAEAMKKK
jgi:Ca2+-binding EF-hand superfamily protein